MWGFYSLGSGQLRYDTSSEVDITYCPGSLVLAWNVVGSAAGGGWPGGLAGIFIFQAFALQLLRCAACEDQVAVLAQGTLAVICSQTFRDLRGVHLYAAGWCASQKRCVPSPGSAILLCMIFL